MVETYERMGITENTDCSAFPADYFPLFSDLLETLQSKNKESMDELTKRDMRTAELYLQKFVSGRYSDIWNAPSTLKTDADLIDFDFQSLFANKNNTVANAQMLLIFRFIEQEVINAREKNKGGANLHTLIIADEAHLYIDPKFPIALDFFYSMSKRIRKYNGSFIPATQNIADWNANEELRGKTSAIIKNSQYSFIFKLSAPDMKDVLDIYKAGDSFNDEEQRMIISAVTGQTFFVGSTELRKSIEGRPAFKRMLSDIQAGLEVDYILVYKLSRFGRNAADILNSLELVQSYGVNLLCIEEGIDSSQASGKLLISVLSAVAEIERENILEQTMNGRREKARQGKWNGGPPPFGYSLNEEVLYIEDDEANIVRLIFDKFVNSNLGYVGIAKYLNLQGIKKKKD